MKWMAEICIYLFFLLWVVFALGNMIVAVYKIVEIAL